MIVDRLATHPDLHLSHLILADHSFADFYGAVNGDQLSEPLKSTKEILFGPLFERQHFISIQVHFSEVVLGLSTVLARYRGMEVQKSAYVRLMIAHARSKKSSLPRQVFKQNFEKMALCLLVRNLVHQHARILGVRKPVLAKRGF
jgi:hypothetical protein